MTVFMIPFMILQLGFAPLTLDDGHTIKAVFVKQGSIVESSGWMIKTGDIADIQASLTGNSCLIRLSEIKQDFESEIRLTQSRCEERVQVIKKDLDESEALNKYLKSELEKERSHSKSLLIGSIVGGVVLTATSLYFGLK